MSINCKIYTPKETVQELLSYNGYKGKKILKKYVIDNSCGQGAILEEVVNTYINVAKKNKIALSEIKKDLEQFIYGYDIDEDSIKKCKEKLNYICELYNINNVNWNLHTTDFLKNDLEIKYDYIIGNPPYISYSDLPEEDRKELKKFQTCQFGKFDYYYAFIEKALNMLNDKGKMTYIVPNSFLKNNSGKELRKTIKPYLKEIVDLSGMQVFTNALVSTCIINLQKVQSNKFNYILKRKKLSKTINKKEVVDKYLYDDIEDFNDNIKFGDCYNVFSAVATLLNKAFLIDEDDCSLNLNESLIRNAASPKILTYDKKKKIIFPYHYSEEGELLKYTEEEMKLNFPTCYNHLLKFKKELEDTDKDINTPFYEYGRSQALTKLNCKKLLISTLITKEVKCFVLDKLTIPYSGLVITPKSEEYSIEKAKTILESERFLKYIRNVAVSASGITKRISSKDIQNFIIGGI